MLLLLLGCEAPAAEAPIHARIADVQVVSAFPAFVDPQGQVTRVCGAPLPGEPSLQPNAVELVVSLLSTGANGVCRQADGTGDRNAAVAQGESVGGLYVTAAGAKPTLRPEHFAMHVECLQKHAPAGGTASCASPLAGTTLAASGLRYAPHAHRCDPTRNASRQNVALVVDHSGSVSGFVDSDALLEEQPGQHFLDPIDPADKSDPHNSRIAAATGFLDQLDDRDRAIAYYFDESDGVQVACSDSKKCIYPDDDHPRNNSKCASDQDCAGGLGCFDDPSLTHDLFSNLPFTGAGENQQNACFDDASPRRHAWLKAGLDQKAKFDGAGRAPLWQALAASFTFLTGSSADGNAGLGASDPKHIVVLVDGPETCTESEQFNYTDFSGQGQCRVPCASAEIDYTELIEKMHAANWPVHLHFVHWQAPAYRQPDARLMELACRSQGTYQFLNTEETDKQDPESYDVLREAVGRVRATLAGSWRPVFTLPADTALPAGQVMALAGRLQVTHAQLPGLAAAYQDADTGRFGVSGPRDGRLLLRRACEGHGQCGGTEACAADHCDGAGLCAPDVAPDQLPCGGGQRCCGGACAAGECEAGCN